MKYNVSTSSKNKNPTSYDLSIKFWKVYLDRSNRFFCWSLLTFSLIFLLGISPEVHAEGWVVNDTNIIDKQVDVSFVEFGASGTIHLKEGGVLSTGRITGDNRKESLVINGGTLRAKGNDDDFISGLHLNHLPTGATSDGVVAIEPSSGFAIGPNGATIDTNGYSVRIDSDFTGQGSGLTTVHGGLRVKNSGTSGGVLTLWGYHEFYNGPITIGAGTTLKQGRQHNVLGRNSNIMIENGGNLDLGGFSVVIAGLFGEIGGKVINSGIHGVEFWIGNNSKNGEFSGNIEGNICLIKNGEGMQILNGSNSYTGTTYIHDGILKGTTNALQGKIVNSATLVFAESGSGIFKGTITGHGEVNIDSGTIRINTPQTYTGATTINNGGDLILDGTLNSNVTLKHGGSLRGVGTVNKHVINSGEFKPGNADMVGIFTINGNYIQNSDGKLFFHINENGSSNELQVQGSVHLAGFIDVKTEDKFIPGKERRYTLISAQKRIIMRDEKAPVSLVINGILVNTAEDTPLQLELQYTDNEENNHVFLQVKQGTFVADKDRTPDLNSLDTVLLSIVSKQPASSADPLHQAIWELELIPKKNILPYLKQLMPQMVINIKEILFNNANTQYGQLTDRLAAIRAGVNGVSLNGMSIDPMAQQISQHEQTLLKDKQGKTVVAYYWDKSKITSEPYSLFATASGIFAKIVTAQDLASLRATTGNFQMGVDYKINENFHSGLYLGYVGIQANFANHSWLKSNGIKFGGYTTVHWDGFYINAILGAGFNNFLLSRPIITNNPLVARGRPSGSELDSLLGGGYEYNLGKWKLGANTSVQYTYLGISSYEETGAGSLNLKVGGQNPGSMISTVGGNISYNWDLTPSIKLLPSVGLAWQHEFLDYGQNIIASFVNVPGQNFFVTSVKGERDRAFGTAGVNAQLGSYLTLYFYYNPVFGGGQVLSHGVLLGLNYNF